MTFPPITATSQLKQLHHSCSERKHTRVLTATQIVSKEVSDHWRTPTATPVNISSDFTAAEFANTQNLEKSSCSHDPKPFKPSEDQNNYRLISLLCVLYKILNRLVHAHVKRTVNLLLPAEQVGFRHERSTVEQSVLLTQNIKDYFEAKRKGRCRVCRSDSDL